jgi:hypothetical protein
MPGRPKTRQALKRLDELGVEEIVARHAAGQSIVSIRTELNITRHAWAKFKANNPGFSQLLADAREEWAENLGMEVVEVADTAHDSESAQVARVRVQARQWAAERLAGMFKPKSEIKAEVNVIHQHLDALRHSQETLEAEIISDPEVDA